MAIVTPHGLEIRLDLPTAFTLLGRLWTRDRQTDALRVLQTCEAIASLQSLMAFTAGAIAAFWPGRPVWSIAVALVFGKLIGILLTQRASSPLIRAFSESIVTRIWSELLGFGLRHILAVVVLYLCFGVTASVAWAAGVLLSELFKYLLQRGMARRLARRVRQPLTGPELQFLSAYRVHARRLGISQDVEVTDEEIRSGLWRDCLADLGAKHPVEVNRFI